MLITRKEKHTNNFTIEGMTLGKLIAIENALLSVQKRTVVQADVLIGIQRAVLKAEVDDGEAYHLSQPS